MHFYVIGDEEVVTGFRFVGVEGSTCNSRTEAVESFSKATRSGDIKVLIITEQVSALIPDEVMEWQFRGSYPLIVELPGMDGHLETRKSLVDSIREAVGVHV
jgi:V/A-type H+-transporting ATPase subunit F